MLIANRHGQSLAEHCALVGLLSGSIVESLYGASEFSRNAGADRVRFMAQTARIAGLLHDIGKLDPAFQTYIKSVQNDTTAPATFEDGEQIADDKDPDADNPLSFQNYPRHQEVSWLMTRQLLDRDDVKSNLLGGDSPSTAAHQSRYGALEYAVFWHHARPMRDQKVRRESFSNAMQMEALMRAHSQWLETQARDALLAFLSEVDRLVGSTLASTVIASAQYPAADAIACPPFKANYTRSGGLAGDALEPSVNSETTRTVVRSALVSADRIVSRLTAVELHDHVVHRTLPGIPADARNLPDLYEQIGAMQRRFEREFPGERTSAQIAAGRALARRAGHEGIVCLQGPAGCGKTRIALEFLLALGSRKKIVIFVPRTAIGEGLFRELSSEYGITTNLEFLSGNSKLFHRAGASDAIETPEGLLHSGDVLITTIDQLCSTMLSHQRIDLVTQLADSHVIFDEFHELFELPGIVALFLETVALRQFCNAGTLLVSATPNPQFLAHLKVEPGAIVQVPSFNTRDYCLRAVDAGVTAYAYGNPTPDHPFLNGRVGLDPAMFMVCNTATLAQQASIVGTNVGAKIICLHSKFTPGDRAALLDRTLTEFGRDAPASDYALVSGPIVQASLNISTTHLHTEACHAESLLQRVGRVNRFARFERATVQVHISRSAQRGELLNAPMLGRLYQKHRTSAFCDYFESRLAPAADGARENVVTLKTLYEWYGDFHASPQARTAYRMDFDAILAESQKVFANNDFDPVQFRRMPRKLSDQAPKMAANSLRGRSYYILPLALSLPDPQAHGKLALLWDGSSAASARLTDELRGAQCSTALQARYLDLSRNAHTPAKISPLIAGAQGVPFFKALAKALRAVKIWDDLRNRARNPDTPIVVASERFNPDNLYYMHYSGVCLGLMQPKPYNQVSARSIAESLQ